MQPDIERNPHPDAALLRAEQRELQTFTEKAQEYMALLLEAGFPIHDVLDRGLYYIYTMRHDSDWNKNMLYAAKAVRQAAHHLMIDADWQERYQHMHSREIRDLMHS